MPIAVGSPGAPDQSHENAAALYGRSEHDHVTLHNSRSVNDPTVDATVWRKDAGARHIKACGEVSDELELDAALEARH